MNGWRGRSVSPSGWSILKGRLFLSRFPVGDYELVLAAAAPGTLDPYGITYHPFTVEAVDGQRVPLPRWRRCATREPACWPRSY